MLGNREDLFVAQFLILNLLCYNRTKKEINMKKTEFEKIINFAIGNEIEAQEFYSQAAEKVKSPQLKDMFNGFAEDEKNHEKLLKGYLKKGPDKMHFKESFDANFAASVDKPKLSVSMHPADALALAMKSEEEAMDFYTYVADLSNDSGEQKVFKELAEMERGHKLKMEKAFKNVTFSADWGM